MHPYAIETAVFSLRWENILIVVGILAGILLAHHRARPKGAAYQDMLLDLYLWLIPAGVVGARLWEMLFTWNNYADTPWDRFAVWKGGISIQGSILGGVLAAVLFAWRRRLRAWELLDVLAPPMLLGQAIGRVGCLLSGDAYGLPVAEVPWFPKWLGLIYSPQSPAFLAYGAQPLIPAEAMEMLADLLILGLLLRCRPERQTPGRTVLLYALLYSMARFLLEFLRGDSLMVMGFKAAQLLALTTAVVALTLLVRRYRATRPGLG